MRGWIGIVSGLAGLWVGASGLGADQGQPDEDARLAAFFQAYLDEAFRAEPLMATRLGDHRFDDKLDDLSPEARAANVERDRRTLAELPRKVDYNTLSRGGQIDYEILRQHLTRAVWLAETFRPFEDDPRTYGDYLTESVYLLLTQSSLPRKTNVRNALARMAEVPRVVETARKTIGRPPRVKVETAVRQTKGAIDFYKGDLYHPGRRTSRGGGAGPARRPGDPGAGGLPGLPRGRGLAPVDRVVADRPGDVRQEARP